MGIGLYARISEDSAGQGLGVARQEQDCRALAQARHWTVSATYVDNDVSAFQVGVVRPEWEHLLDDLAQGRIEGIVCYDLDRLARQPKDLERAIELYDKRPGLHFATVQGDVNLASADGRTMARVMVAFANKSSMDTSRRVRRKFLDDARKGKSASRRVRPFGWMPDRLTLDPEESKLIQDAVEDIIRGIPFGAIVRRWQERGVVTPEGNPWIYTSLRRMLLSPRLAGVATLRGDILYDEGGLPIKGQWEPVLSRDSWDILCAALHSGIAGTRPGSKKYLLSGIARCGRCGARMVGSAQPKRNRYLYRCPSPLSRFVSCGKNNIDGKRTDDLVSTVILTRLRGIHIPAPDDKPWPNAPELERIEAKQAAIMDEWVANNLPASALARTISKLEQTAENLRTERTEWLRSRMSVVVDAQALDDSWPSLPVEERRHIVSLQVEAVLVLPSEHGRVFDPGRVRIAWR